tara:strand:- start:176 stop:463 length:288 start_codon:yes stop_codon:yes gene_type:complete
MTLQLIKETLEDLIVASNALKENKRDAERALSNAISGDFDWDTDKQIEELTGACSDTIHDMDKTFDEIRDIQDRLELMIANVEFEEVAQMAIKAI